MNSKKKLELIDKVLEWHMEGACLYCGATLNGDLLADDFDDFQSDDYCLNCGKNIDPYDEWDASAVEAIRKIVNDERFVP
ncbi:MAG: hypothetical protein GF317_01050 [Candidatus Lokiarchaeota archaeon]|jgi:hypothetical protein|nr:hypothetical protein [Candidatus Lokiarchaeota archaeon]MBD3198546.1 hypothetical protein [Candidatus Lokiarchaeota archaeon]